MAWTLLALMLLLVAVAGHGYLGTASTPEPQSHPYLPVAAMAQGSPSALQQLRQEQRALEEQLENLRDDHRDLLDRLEQLQQFLDRPVAATRLH